MGIEEAVVLLGTSRNKEVSEAEADDARKLLEDLHCLPLAMSTSIRGYLSKLAEREQRWRVLEKTEFDRYRQKVPDSVLRTWSISIERIRLDNETAHRILHIITYVSNQNIPFGIISARLFSDERQKAA